jgi:hypothetical protein
VVKLAKEAKRAFKNLLTQRGYQEKAADTLWEWYDSRKKKGAASF